MVVDSYQEVFIHLFILLNHYWQFSIGTTKKQNYLFSGSQLFPTPPFTLKKYVPEYSSRFQKFTLYKIIQGKKMLSNFIQLTIFLTT